MQVTDFLVDLVKRFLAKSPKFFKWIQVISLVTALVTGLPDLLETVGIVLPEKFAILQNKAVAIAALVATFIAQLTVKEGESVKTELKFK